MIVSLKGTLIEKNAEGLVIEVSNVGYFVCMSVTSLDRLPPLGEELQIFVAESVAMYGGGVTLYGFLSAEEKRIFNAFRDHLPGTGAKKALPRLVTSAHVLSP